MTKIGKHMLAESDGFFWHVTTKQGEPLGIIEWNSQWKKYEFWPESDTGFTHDCLTALAEFVQRCTREKAS